MMEFMKLFWMFATIAMLASGASPELSGIKTVYMLPMSSGLDQYLAVRLTTGSVFQVVTDPLKADAIFTDRIGANLEQTLHDLYEPKSKDADNKSDDSKPTMAPLSRG